MNKKTNNHQEKLKKQLTKRVLSAIINVVFGIPENTKKSHKEKNLMKNTLRNVLVIALAALMLFSLASCGKKLSGTYTADVLGTGSKMVFKGKDVTVSVTVLGQEIASVEGTYKIKDGEITFEFSNDEADEDAKDVLDALSGTLTFEEGDDYIKIGGTKYNLEKKD